MRTLDHVDLSFFTDAPNVIRSQALIAAPRSRVFACISGDPAGWGDWFPGFNHAGRWQTPAPHGVGSVRTVAAFRVHYRETILAWDPEERWAFRVDETDSGMFAAFAEDYRLVDDGSATRLIWTVAFRPNRALGLAGPLAPPVFHWMARRVASGLTKSA